MTNRAHVGKKNILPCSLQQRVLCGYYFPTNKLLYELTLFIILLYTVKYVCVSTIITAHSMPHMTYTNNSAQCWNWQRVTHDIY